MSRGYCLGQCTDFSLQWLLLLWSTGCRDAGFSSCGSWTLQHRLNRDGTQVQLLSELWDLPDQFTDQGSNPSLLHCQAGSLPLSHQGRPGRQILNHWATWEVPYFLLINSVCLTNSVSHTYILKNAFVSAQSCTILWTLWIVAHKAPLSMGFSRQEFWRGFPSPLPGDLPY